MKLVRGLSLAFALGATAWCQHGASAGHASSAHSSAGFSSTRSFSMTSTGTGRTNGSVAPYHPNLSSPPRSLYTSPIGPPPYGGTQPITGHRPAYPTNRYRPNYYSTGLYYGPGLLSYGYGYSDDSYSGDQQVPQGVPDLNAQVQQGAEGGYDPGYGQAPPRQSYQPQAPAMAEVPEQPQITLLFKDGRPPQQVQNYAVTRNTLYVLDGAKRREIPLDELDLPQTEKANRDAGLDFEIPAGAE